MTSVVRLLAALLVALPLLHPGASRAADADVRRTWQMLDYLGVDYAGAVKDGQVASPSEFGEMREFAHGARARIAALPPAPEQGALLREADALAAAIEARAAPARVATLAHGLGDRLLAAYPVPLAPAQAPDAARGAAVYQSTCAACHGATGHGDGPVGVTLDPRPVAFADTARARQRSVFALYQAASQGIQGTAMPAFGQLPEADRWAVATYVGRFAHDDAQVAAGRALWSSDAQVRDAIGGLDGFVRTTEAGLAQSVGGERAGAVLAYLHAQPQVLAAVPAAGGGGLGLARERLRASVAAQAAGDAAKAGDLALSSYLDGVEPWEQALAARDAPLKDAIETAMSRYRALLAAGAPPAQVRTEAASVDALLARGDLALAQSAGDASAAFFGSFAILLREGIEALLVVVAMIAFLRQAERRDMLAWVHAGWAGALAAGALTWAAATWLVRISGANREVTEGLSSLFAALVLLSVGVWMHQKSVAGQWQAYLRERMAAALTRRSALFMAGLAFLAVYREVFETILFYAALWGQGHDGAIVGGLVAAGACLAAISVLLLRFSARLPIGQFFSWSSWLVAVLAVVLTGKGVAALQEAGWIAPGAWSSPRVEVLGIYPSAIGLVAQGVVLATVLLFFLRSARTPGKASAG